MPWQACLISPSCVIQVCDTCCCADCGARGTFLQSSLDLLQPVVLAAFSASSAAHEEIAWPVLLPALIAVAEQLDQTCRGQFADALWSACRSASCPPTWCEGTQLCCLLLLSVSQLFICLRRLHTPVLRMGCDHIPLRLDLTCCNGSKTTKQHRAQVRHFFSVCLARPHMRISCLCCERDCTVVRQ